MSETLEEALFANKIYLPAIPTPSRNAIIIGLQPEAQNNALAANC